LPLWRLQNFKKPRGTRLANGDCAASLFMRQRGLRQAKDETPILAAKQIRALAEKNASSANAVAKTKRVRLPEA
jgi:hypothetical protein